MQHSRKSGQSSYRHVLLAGMRRFLPAPLFSAARRDERRWSDCFLALGAIMVSWACHKSIKDRVASTVDALTEMFFHHRRPGGTEQGFFEAMDRRGEALLSQLRLHLRQRVQEVAGRIGCWRHQGFLAFAADGTRVEVPRTRKNQEQLRCAGRDKTGPQLQLTAIRHLGSLLPWDWQIGPGTDAERTHVRTMLGTLPTGALLVADAGFTGYDLFQEILDSGLHLLIRVGANVSLLSELGYAQVEDGQTVYLWPAKAHKARQRPIVLRLLNIDDEGERVCLLTDLPADAMSQEQAVDLYALRWGMEVGFRTLKQTMGHRKMLSCSPRRAKMELHWGMLGQTLLELMGVDAQAGPDDVSPACVQRVVRRAMEKAHTPCHRRWLIKALAGARKDHYQRNRPKTSRDYPRKKREKPPGQPKILKADASLVQIAKELTPLAPPPVLAA